MTEPASTQQAGGFCGHDLNRQETMPIAWAVGKLLVNFGAIELSARAWLHGVSGDEQLVDALDDLPLRKRIGIIRRLIKQGRVPSAFAERAESVWAEVDTLAELRNQVAHNPVILGWHGEERPGQPDFGGILDRRKSARSRKGPALISLAELEAAVDRTAHIGQELYSIGLEMDGAGGWPAHPTTDEAMRAAPAGAVQASLES